MYVDYFAETLFSRTRARVLAVLVTAPDHELHLREIARRAGMDATGIGRELRKLVELGLLSSRIVGRQRMFSLNRDCPVFEEIASIIRKTAGVMEALREALMPLGPRIKLAYIYGSYARGTMRADSDIDLMVVGRATLLDVVGAISGISERFGREINPTVFSTREYRRELNRKKGFVHETHFGVKIALIGGEDEIA
jgi:predicted nucleotidyltransferase